MLAWIRLRSEDWAAAQGQKKKARG